MATRRALANPTAFRFSERHSALLRALAEALDLPMVRVLEMALRDLAAKEGIAAEPAK